MKTYIIYHNYKPGKPCADGQTAAWIAAKALPNAEVIGWVYQTPPPDFLKPGDSVICVDFSFPAAVLNQWEQQGIKVTIIDHHESALNNLSGLSDRILLDFDLSECGATLTWKYFFPNQPMPVFLNYVRDRDLWNWDLAETYAVHEAMGAIGRTFQLFDKLAAMSKQELLNYLLPIGEPLAAPKQKLVREVASRFTWSNVAGYNVPLVQLEKHEERLASEVCTVLYKRFPQAPFTACVSVRADGINYELRSDKNGNDTNVYAIAETLGGGGHRNSAGYRISK